MSSEPECICDSRYLPNHDKDCAWWIWKKTGVDPTVIDLDSDDSVDEFYIPIDKLYLRSIRAPEPKEQFAELVRSITKYDQVLPIKIAPMINGKFPVIDGVRRVMAFQALGRSKIRAKLVI